MNKVAHSVQYINNLDTTISGSRNALTPLILWYAIQIRGKKGFENEAKECIKKAKYLYNQMLKISLKPQLNDFSNIVFFKEPNDRIKEKWVLATQDGISHAIIMQNTDTKKINAFVKDLNLEINR